MPIKNKKSPRRSKSKTRSKTRNGKNTSHKKASRKKGERVEKCRTAVRTKSRLPKTRKKSQQDQEEDDPKTEKIPTCVLTESFPIVTRSMTQRYSDWLQSFFGSSQAWRVNQLLHPEMYGPTSIVTRSASRRLATGHRQSDSPTGQFETSQHFPPTDHPKGTICDPGGRLSHGDDMHILSLENTSHPIAQFDSNDLESMIIDEGSNAYDDPEKRGWLGVNERINQSPCTLEVVTVRSLETIHQNIGSEYQNPYTQDLKRDVGVQTDGQGDIEQLLTSSTHNALGDSNIAMEVEIQNMESSGIKNPFLTHDRGEQISNQESSQFNNSVGKDRRTAQSSDRVRNVLHFDRSCPSIYSHYILADFSTPTRVITRMEPPEARQHQIDLEATLAHLRDVLQSKNLPGLELDKFRKYRS